jgi:uncharacterized membrane protein
LPSERSLRIASGALACVGAGVAAYIAIVEAGGGAPQCVAGGHGCETVANSDYADLAGINVAAIGIFGYLTLLGAALVPGDPGRFAGLLLGLVGFGFSIYLTYLEFGVINAVCQWCLLSASLMTLMLAVNGIRAYLYAGSELAGGEPGLTHNDAKEVMPGDG